MIPTKNPFFYSNLNLFFFFLQTIIGIYNYFLINFENTGVNTFSITNSKRNILANLQTNDDLLHELDNDEQSGIHSSDYDTSSKKYELLQECNSNIL